jgi:hypothetical protein
MTATREIVTDVDVHAWRTQSSHQTSEGVLHYQRCACGVWRVLVGSDRVLANRVGVRATHPARELSGWGGSCP